LEYGKITVLVDDSLLPYANHHIYSSWVENGSHQRDDILLVGCVGE